VRDVIEDFSSTPAFLQIDNAVNFPEWIAHVFKIRDLPSEPTPESIVDHVQWALEARRTYLACLKALFPGTFPRWVYAIFKLGRYAIASMALLHLASEFPTLFNPMLIEPAIAPPKTRFTSVGERMPLTSVLRRLAISQEVNHYISRLGQIWGVQDPEAHFRNACTLHLPVHAEMQLLNFYDNNPKRRPSFRFIGVSKKSCFLCQWFLTRHPQSFNVASCHQKLYLNWRPPPAANTTIYKQYKAIVTDLSKVMESVAKQELQNRLGLRRPVPPDSTAGVSVSGLMVFNKRSQDRSALPETVTTSTKSIVREIVCTTPSPHPIPVVDASSPDEEFSRVPHNSSPVDDSFSSAEMVFHVMRMNEVQMQDIIAIGDIIDHHSGEPSWAKLVDLLGDESGVSLRDGDFLMVNNRIRVGNERQLLACLQYLRNETVLNSEVYVHNSSTVLHHPGVT
jgi:hypothetical protein